MEAVQEIELPKIKGSPVDQLPENLYVPPKALLLLLDVFSLNKKVQFIIPFY